MDKNEKGIQVGESCGEGAQPVQFTFDTKYPIQKPFREQDKQADPTAKSYSGKLFCLCNGSP